VVDYKCKTGEIIKRGKYPRAVGDLSAPGASVAGYFMDWVKEAFSIPYRDGKYTYTFIKQPDHNVLQSVFHDLIYPTGVHLFYFSDDSCISALCSDGNFVANLDISACDGSNFDPIFNILEFIMSVDDRYNADIKAVFDQLELPCEVRTVHDKILAKAGRVTLTPKGKVLYSGSVLTTSTNNTANMVFGLCLKRILGQRSFTKKEFGDAVIKAGECAGYIFKIDMCDNYSDIQFLKHSPAMVGGVIVPFLNLGTMLRSLGTCIGDLPGKRKNHLYQRAEIFYSDVVKSYIHAGNTSVLKALQTRVIKKTFGLKHIRGVIPYLRSSCHIPIDIPDEELTRRYKVGPQDIQELVLYLISSKFGEIISLPVVDMIMAKDYGY